MTVQTLLKNIENQIKEGKPPFVVMSLEQWEQIEDTIKELSSPQLLKSIRQARHDYKKGKAVLYEFLKK